jgi:outer membrane lipoprotein-sorting protein
MKKIIYLFIFTIVFASCKNDNAKTNADSSIKEVAAEMAGMKTYMIQYKMEMDATGIKSTSLVTQYIDMKNDKSAIETETSGEMMGVKTDEKSLTIIDENWTYVINLKDKTGMKMKNDEVEDDPMEMIKSDDDVTFRQMIEKDGGKIVGNETFLGKKCIVVELSQEGQTMKMWYYKGIPLKMENQLYKMEATKFEENVSIPASKFVVPDGIKLSEMPSMPEMN